MWLKGCTDKEIVSATGMTGHMVREYARENNIKREVRKLGAPSKYSEEVK
ncbi:hypothetical protein GM3708_3514 (plasmid) [Geminocystis sp. NIES-3708]|nr:hypothetical protein GM3708_3514 [Geminocystis sp. NIES-3708]